MIDEKRDFCLFKVGFASSLLARFYQYTTHNPLADCISSIQTMEKSKRAIEDRFHNEIIARGYNFVNAKIDHKRTEWFAISYDDPFYMELKTCGLNAFKCGKNRKNYGTYRAR
jgi:hypothetical protein